MAHNVLVLASATLPCHSAERRRLGLSPPPRRGRSPRDHPAGWVCVRLESVPRSLAANLRGAMLRAGGTAEVTPDRAGSDLTVTLAGERDALDTFLRPHRRTAAARIAAREIEAALRHSGRGSPPLRLRRGRLPLGRHTVVMGILNVTPDSFSDGGRFADRSSAVAQALRMAEEGAEIIDVGGESTRPGAHPVPLREELRRVIPVLETLIPRLERSGKGRPLVSIDTTKAEVARRAAEVGVDMVNDISGLGFDPAMPDAVAASGLPVVISHIRKTPRTMRRPPRYAHLLPEIAAFLRERIDLALRAGVREDRILIDPGIGFGKGRRDNLVILRYLAILRSLGRPILIGTSRKSFIGRTLDLETSERLEASLASEALVIAGGADIIRAHDVLQAVRAARLCDAVLGRAAPRARR